MKDLTMHRGSLQYWQKRRARRRLPRLRSFPNLGSELALTNIVAFKVGMTHMGMIDNSEAASKGTEIATACTVLEVPQMEIYGIRLYKKNENFYSESSIAIYSKALAGKLGMKNIKNDETKISAIKQHIGDYSDVRALVVAYPKSIGLGSHPIRFEAGVGGKSISEKFDFIAGKLGSPVDAQQYFKNGEYIDISSISKGKGWQGVIKRFGTARLSHKATQKVRHIGTLGPFKPPKVIFTVPHSGQLGFNYRTEHNKLILKVGAKSETGQINKQGGFLNYGMLNNDYVVIKGSVPGPAKRLVQLRKSIQNRNANGIKEPKITYIIK
ncbi:MAG: 50S ribosomal protein L3 [Candidatus Micrarchaeaceae archaeon]